jgi:hypothetical protein
VYIALEEYEEGIQRTKLQLSRFQFNPVPVICNLLSLARLSVKVGQDHEASVYYDRALKEARRMELYMTELMLLHANQSDVFGQEHKVSDADASSVAISKMVEATESYGPLLKQEV